MTTEALIQSLHHYDSNKPDTFRTIENILKRGADPNVIFYEDGVCAMLLAAGLGSSVMSLLLKHHGDPNIQSLDGTTPLHVAASWGDFDTLKLLLHSGANADVIDQDGKRALDLALENGYDLCSEELKVHTMLAAYEDVEISPKFSLDEDPRKKVQYFPPYATNDHINGSSSITMKGSQMRMCDLDKSFIEPEVLSSAYSKTVTRQVYDYLEEGRKICLDATSPTTPIVVLKSVPSVHCPPCSRSPNLEISHHCDPHHCHPCHESFSQNTITRNSCHCNPFPSPDYKSCDYYSPPTTLKSCTLHDSSPCGSSKRTKGVSTSSVHAMSNGLSGNDVRRRLQVNHFDLSPIINNSGYSSPDSPKKVHKSHEYSSCSPFQNGTGTSTQKETVKRNFSNNVLVCRPRNYHTEESSVLKDKKCHKQDNPENDQNLENLTEISLAMRDVKLSSDRLPVSPIGSETKSARTAAFVLSCPDILSHIDALPPNNTRSLLNADSQHLTQVSCNESFQNIEENVPLDKGFHSGKTEKANKPISVKKSRTSGTQAFIASHGRASSNLNSSSSSCDSYLTCNSIVGDGEDVQDKSVSVQSPHSADKNDSSQSVPQREKQKWQAPLFDLIESDLMTSDDSFVIPERVEQKSERAKSSIVNNFPCTFYKDSYTKGKKIPEDEHGPCLTVPPYKGSVSNEKARLSDESLFSTISVKDYIYNDKERGITLIERHVPSECGTSVGRRSLDSVCSKVSVDSKTSLDSQCTLIYDWRSVKPASQISEKSDNLNDTLVISSEELSESVHLEISCSSESLIIPSWIESLTNEEVTRELQKFGEIPGPVISCTRQVYLRRLASLESNPGLVKLSKSSPDYPNELRKALDGLFDFSSELANLEVEMANSFSTSLGKQWREGTAKSSFTYLLLDPRVTNNLPFRSKELSEIEAFKCFICSIFYIGKGKRARPYCHLYEAVSKMKNNDSKLSDKVKHIIDIWKDGHGVVSLHCFQSVIPVEAYTREACMLEAIGLHKITNVKRGDFYGIASSWSIHQRRQLGVLLLKKVFAIFLAEGERQIFIPDLK